MKLKELKYYGLHACLAIWQKRPKDIIRVYLERSNLKILGGLLKWCASQKIAYHVVESQELAKICDSVHHEGVCVLAKERKPSSWQEFCSAIESGSHSICLLYLDGVQNPHNVGSIIRTAAHFQIPFILGKEGQMPAVSPSACRVAKGGAEVVQLVSISKPLTAFQWLQKKGFSVIGTSSHEGRSIYQFDFPKRSIIAMGSESDGVGDLVQSQAKHHIQIPGSRLVESLNVSVATSLCLGEYYRQHFGR